ncbi:hypothetical protein J7M22_11225 [Candidatus Poribacteria bacterium]|nr:hypothetical protein [Candidatus Poribacteria bacterium]
MKFKLVDRSDLSTIGLLYAIKGAGQKAFYRWFKRDYLHLFPHLPERTRLFRLFKTHFNWTERFMADPTIMGVADSYGIEFIHPIREGRSKRQIYPSYPEIRWKNDNSG